MLEQLRASYRRMIEKRGEIIRIRRYTGAGATRPRFDVEVRGVVSGYRADELIGSITQGDRKVIVLVEDLINRQFALPITANDKVHVRGRELAIIAPDDSTRRYAGKLIAYELTVRG